MRIAAATSWLLHSRGDVMVSPAETYERSIVPHLFRPWAQALVERIGVQPGERVLDVACGTGVVAREVAKISGHEARITGVDFSPGMLAVAEQEATRDGVSAEWRQADACELPFEDASFDVILCQQGLQFVPDKGMAVREMHRVLAPGGRVAISVWRELERHTFFAALDAVMRERLNVGAAAAPFAFPDGDALRGLLSDAGFTEITLEQPSRTARYPEPERNLYETIHALIAVAPDLQSLDADARERMIEEVSHEMRAAHAAAVDGDYVLLQWHANVATARRSVG